MVEQHLARNEEEDPHPMSEPINRHGTGAQSLVTALERTDGEQITGAQSLITSLEAAGVDRHLRHPRRRDPAGVRPADGLHDPAHPGPPRAGRRPRRAGVRRGDRPGRRLHGDVRPGRDQPGHADRRRAHGLGADGRRHRPGRRRRDRHRRLPGGRHPRHHDADHQAQLPGHRPRRDPAPDRRGVPHRRDRPPRPGARRHRQVRAAGDDDVRVAEPSCTCPATAR